MLKSKILSQYEIHDCDRISQGDILRDVNFFIVDKNDAIVELDFQYIIVLSQDCDLENGCGIYNQDEEKTDSCPVFNQFLPSVLFVPAFPSEILRSGEHIKSLYKVIATKITSALWKPITQNQNPRFHFLEANVELQLPDLVLDFKSYYTLPYKYIFSKYEKSYLSTVNELFRENLSQRFTNYLNRIGLPVIPPRTS